MKNLSLIIWFLAVSFCFFFGPTGISGEYIIWDPLNSEIHFGPKEILKKLHKEKIIRHPSSLLFIWRFTQGDKRLNIGPIHLTGKEWVWEISKKLEEYRPYYKKVTIYEGESLVSSYKKLCNLIFDNDQICKNKKMYDYKSNYIIANTYKLDLVEGFESYELEAGSFESYKKKYLKIIKPLFIFSNNFIKKENLPEDEVKRIFTIASIIESETKVEAEKKIISGVIGNRTKKNMNFEIDATVLFCFELSLKSDFLDSEKPTRLFYRDLDIDCEYNTYKYPGLPPGPISAPSFSSINAAINPANHSYYFYVLDKDGVNHYFSETYDEHLGYIKLLREDFESDS